MSPILKTAAPTAPKMPLWLFFLLTYLIAWCFWIVPVLGSHGVIRISGGMNMACLIAGSFVPLVMAFVSSWRDGGWPEARRFGARALRWRIAPRYLLAALLLVPVLALVAAWIYAHLGGPAVALALPVAQIPMTFVTLFFVGGSINEEFGWAYAIDRLQRGRRLLPAAVELGVIWAFWHLPLFFIVGLTQSFMPIWAFVAMCVGLRILFVWAHDGTGKSILVALLFHTSANIALNLFALLNRSLPARNEQYGFMAFALLILGAAVIVALTSNRFRGAAVPAAALADAP